MKHLILVEIFPRYKKIISGGIEWNSIDVTSLSLSTTFQILVCILALHNVQLYFQRVHTILPFVSSLPPSLSLLFYIFLLLVRSMKNSSLLIRVITITGMIIFI